MSVLSLIHNVTTLLFGVYISAAFLGIRMNRKNAFILFGFSCSVGALFLLSFILFGEGVTEQIYPLIIHFPLVLFLTCFYKYRTALSVLSVLTAYLCCQLSNWIGIAVLYFTHKWWVYYSVRIVITVVGFAFLMRFISDATSGLWQKPSRAIMILSIMPFIYYFFDYATSVYTELLYSGIDVVVEFLGFVLCISYILFMVLYFKQYEEKCEEQRRLQLIKMQQEQSKKEIEAIKRSEQTVSIIRHDMRHFLSNISAFVSNGETEKAQEYIGDIIDAIDKTTAKKYCKNETVNMILSFNEEKIKNNGIDFVYNIQIPEKLPFSDVDLTAILSNGIENAIKAVIPLEEGKRHIELDMRMNEEKLLISVKNTFSEMPEFVDSLPHTERVGHGIGTQSIQYVAEKLKGNCQFTIDDNMFVLRVIL